MDLRANNMGRWKKRLVEFDTDPRTTWKEVQKREEVIG